MGKVSLSASFVLIRYAPGIRTALKSSLAVAAICPNGPVAFAGALNTVCPV